MSARGLTVGVLASLCALIGSLALSSVSARAAVTHGYLSRIAEIPAEGPKGEAVPLPGPLFGPAAMTIDSGKLWISEHVEGTRNFRVDEFNSSSGAFMSQLAQPGPALNYFDNGIAVGHSTGETQLYVGTDAYPEGRPEGAVAVYNAAGELQKVWDGADTPNKTFGCFQCIGLGDVAVDDSTSLGDWASGDVFVSSPIQRVVDVFAPEAKGGEKYLAQLTGPEPGVLFSEPRGVAVSAFNGDVLVADGAALDVFEPTALNEYALVRQLTGTPGATFAGSVAHVAVDGGSGDIYVSEERVPVVDEFSATGVYLGQIAGVGSPGGDFKGVTSIAVDPETHRVYVGDHRGIEGGFVDVFGPNDVVPDVTTGAVTGQKATGEGRIEATLNGTVNPDKAGPVTCQFDWGTTSALGQVAPCTAQVPDGEAAEPVHAVLGGLPPDTKYFYRLQATNANGANLGESWQIQEFTSAGTGIGGEAVSVVRAESVTFDATLNPNNFPTTYYFQYGATAAYGSDVPAAPGASIGSGEAALEVTQHVQGLSAATVYHYRVVAASELVPGKTELFYGPDQTFRSQTVGASLQLPDGRAYEMVSPPHKEGALLNVEGQASADGKAFEDSSLLVPTEANPPGSNIHVPTFFGRGGHGWISKVIAPPHITSTGVPVGNSNEYRVFSKDLSKGVVDPYGSFTQLSPDATESTAYLRTLYANGDPAEPCSSGCYEPLVSALNVPSGTKFGEESHGECESVFCGPEALDATPDLSHVVLKSPFALTATSTEGLEGLYEWGAGRLQMVNLLPPGETNGKGGHVGIAPDMGDSAGGLTRHAISDDGSRVVWHGGTGAEFTNHLYLRDTVRGETVRLDLFQGVPEGSNGNGPEYVTASNDGSRIFFLDDERLTADATAKDSEPDLYEYDLNAPAGSRLTDLTVDKNVYETAHVASVVGSSEDSSYLYFTAAGALAPGASPGMCGGNNPQPGETQQCNLYVRHNGTLTFIAGLSQQDYPDWTTSLDFMPARVSPNGAWLAFMSNENLTGYDTTDAVGHAADEEVYLYDASANRLVCGSCNPTGSRPVGHRPDHSGPISQFGLFTHAWVASIVPPWTDYNVVEARYQPRYLSNDGRLFFDSHDALVPQDVNGTGDVYEFEPSGVGDCRPSSTTFSEKLGGCVALISSGTSNEESAFLDASETGGDVFFLTPAQLLSRDFDNQLDIYDARECSANSPCIATPPVEPPPCDTGDSCKSAPAPQPEVFGLPPSATFSGSGNVPPPVSEKGSRSGKPPALTRSQKRARALRACRVKRNRRKRTTCERQVRARYAATKQSRKVNATKRGRG